MPSSKQVKEGFTLVYSVYADFSQAPFKPMLKASIIHLLRPVIEFYCIWTSFILKRKIGVGQNMIPNNEVSRAQKPINIDLTKVDPKNVKFSIEKVEKPI